MSVYRFPVTPAVLSRPLAALCEQLVPGGSPLYVDVVPVPGAPVEECFAIVDDRIRREGGSSVIGWALHELPTLFIEAQFHAVWQPPQGALLDITPKTVPSQRSFFLPDPARKYQGRQVTNVWKALRADSTVLGFLKMSEREFEFLNRGPRAEEFGTIVLKGAEAAIYEKIRLKKELFYYQMLQMLPEIGPEDPCWCGSGKKSNSCHGVES